jgi:hypothetical protein
MLRFIFTASLALFAAGCSAQTDQASAVQPPSSLIRPALESVGRAGSGVDLNKWKGSTAMREEVDGNLASMQKDLQTTLPALLSVADAAPGSPAASLPVLLNVDALYNVLLRVTVSSRSGAPRDQNIALEQSAVLLDSARRDLGEAITASARAQEKRIADLQATVQQQAAALAAAATPLPAPTVAAKPKRKKTTIPAKPTTTAKPPATQ